jgi:hypothetical protein
MSARYDGNDGNKESTEANNAIILIGRDFSKFSKSSVANFLRKNSSSDLSSIETADDNSSVDSDIITLTPPNSPKNSDTKKIKYNVHTLVQTMHFEYSVNTLLQAIQSKIVASETSAKLAATQHVASQYAPDGSLQSYPTAAGQVTITKELGSGNHGVVYAATNTNGEELVIKAFWHKPRFYKRSKRYA